MPTKPLPLQSTQHVIDATPVAAGLPASEVVVNQLPFRKVAGQQAPLNAGDDHIPQSVENPPLMNAAGSPAGFWGQHGFDKLPLSIGEVSGVMLFGHTFNLLHRLTDAIY